MNTGKDNKEGKDKPMPNPKLEQGDAKSRVRVTERPFTLHIDDTPENVARALFGQPLKRE